MNMEKLHNRKVIYLADEDTHLSTIAKKLINSRVCVTNARWTMERYMILIQSKIVFPPTVQIW